MKVKKYRQVETLLERLISIVQRKLHMFPSPRLSVCIETIGPDGEIKDRTEFKSNSFVRNAYNIVAFQIGAFQTYHAGYGDSFNSLKDLTGAVRNLGSGTSDSNEPASCYRVGGTGTLAINAPDSFLLAGGVIIGSSLNAESIDDYILGNRITNGAGPGQLAEVSSSNSSGQWDASNRLVSSFYSKTFTNNSGGNVTVTEIGLLNKIKTGSTGAVYDFLWARDVLPEPIVMANGDTKTFTYTLRFPF